MISLVSKALPRAPRLARYASRLTSGLGEQGNCIRVDNPYSGDVEFEVPEHSPIEMLQIIDDGHAAFQNWRHSPLDERIELCNSFIDEFELRGNKIAKEVTLQMGKPLEQAKKEVQTAIFRSRSLVAMATECLTPHILSSQNGIVRRIDREPIGNVLVLCPWNYPLACAIGSLIPAVLAGNAVIIKHSDKTPLCAESFSSSFKAAGAPHGLVSALHVSHDLVSEAIAHPATAYVAFTGSVIGGRQVYEAVAKRFIDAGLELGGKDGAYIASDADVSVAAAGIVDGACYNSGQSCCSVERAYVHEDVYDEFMQKALREFALYKIGDPLKSETTMGPMAQPASIQFLASQIKHAEIAGAKVVFGGSSTSDAAGFGRFFQPSLIDNCNHDMSLMMDESFGPILAVMRVSSDEEAIDLMNDSAFGLTGSIWTTDPDRADALCAQLDVGTVFQNMCDYLDPELPWSGRRDSGKGISLSHLGFNSVTKTKSFNLRRA